MRPLRVWLVYFCSVLFAGSTVAPWIHRAVAALAGSSGVFADLAGHPFHRYVNRCLLVAALLGLAIPLRALQFRSFSDAGIRALSRDLRPFLLGVLAGFGSMAVMVILIVGLGYRTWWFEHSAREWAKLLLNATASALAVACLEEVLFRGAVLGSFLRAGTVRTGLWTSTLIYAWVHFFSPIVWKAPVVWTSGYAALGGMMRGWVDPGMLFPGLLNLALAGGILGVLYWRTGSLQSSIGLHAGWIFWLKCYGFVTMPAVAVGSAVSGSGKLIDGWIALPVLGLMLLGALKLRCGENRT